MSEPTAHEPFTYPRTIVTVDGLTLTQTSPPNSYLVVTRDRDGFQITSAPCVVTEDKDEIIRLLFVAWMRLARASSGSRASDKET